MSVRKERLEQARLWDVAYSANAAFFGDAPSAFAQSTLRLFKDAGAQTLLELGAGQGRDTVLFAQHGLHVVALDYADHSVRALHALHAEGADTVAVQRGRAGRITACRHDVRTPLPLADNSVDAVYAHMLLCMHLEWREILFALGEMRRVLRAGGLCVYTVRSVFDKHYGAGRHITEHMYDVGGFTVHFFDAAMIRHAAAGYELLRVERMEEGSLPRDLFAVVMRKADKAGGPDLQASAVNTQQPVAASVRVATGAT